MKKIIFFISLVLSLILFAISFNIFLKAVDFSHDNVLQNINYISSDNFKGRLPGTIENEETAQYIKSEFKKYGLVPLSAGYMQAFTSDYPARTDGKPYLKVYDSKGNMLKEYVYNRDYKEDMLNFRKNTAEFRKDDCFISAHSIQIKQGSEIIVFYVPDNSNLSFRSSFSESAQGAMYIMITENTFSDIKNLLNKGCMIKCYIPYVVKETKLYNVAGILKGKNSELPPLIISAHFDHVGTDLEGNIYNGALDNASGTSFMLELCRYIKSLGKPERNIIFVAFNAEEFGFKGSEAFEKCYYKSIEKGKILNFDMIGGSSSVPLCIMGGSKDTAETPFIHAIAENCTNQNIYFSYLFQDASDHEPFRLNNINAVTFCDNDMSKIHTLSDKSSQINVSSIDRCYKAVAPEILQYAYHNNILLFYYRDTLVISFIGMILFPFLIYKTHDSVKV